MGVDFKDNVAIAENGASPKTWGRQDDIRMWKNVVVVSLGFMFLFTAFQNMAALQSSLNESEGIGVYTLATIYATIILSCFFLPTFIIKKLKVKKSLVVCQFMYTLYIAAQFYPKWGTLIPAAFVLGLGAAPMWSAKCTYLSQMGTYAGRMKGVNPEILINRFFGIFFMLFQTWGIWGNIVSVTVLKPDEGFNRTQEEINMMCGANYVVPKVAVDGSNTDTETTTSGPNQTQVYTLAGIYLCFSVIGPFIIMFFLDPLSTYGEDERREQEGKSGIQLLMATFSHFANNKYQMLITPLTIWSGMEQGWFGASFTVAYIKCPIGIQYIGYFIIVYASADAFCSVTFGYLLKKIGRVPVFTMATVLNLVVIFILLNWTPTTHSYLYLFAIMWGMSDAVWQTQINAFYGVIFVGNEEPAFANYRLWESIGFLAAYLLSNNLQLKVFMYFMVAWLVASYSGYTVIEVLEKKRTGSCSVYPCTGGVVVVTPKDQEK